MDIKSEDYNKIISFIQKKIKNPSLELEIRLCGNKFNNTLNNIRLNQLEFQRLLQQLTVSKDLNGLGLKYENNKTLDITCESITERVIINDIDNIKKYWLMDNLLLSNIKYSGLQKDLIDNLDLNDYSIRFSLCNESELESVSEEIEYENKLFRYKNRYSIFTEDDMFRFDLSEVKTSEGNTIKESKLFKKINEYEIEIEYIGDSKDKDYIFDKLIYNVGVLISLYQDSYYIVSQNTYDSIKTLYVSITGTEKFIAANPITLQLKNLVKSKKYINIFNNYAVTYKADGERNFLIVNDNLFLINNNFHIRSLGISNKSWNGSIFECEFVDNTVLIYDILYHTQKDVRNRPLLGSNSRQSMIDEFVSNIESNEIYKVSKKEHKTSPNIFETINALLNDVNKLTYTTDGLIFTPINERYPNNGGTWEYLFKWKPEKLNSIDFLVKVMKEKNIDIKLPYLLYDKMIQYKKVQLMVTGYREVYNSNSNKREKKCVPIEFKPFNQEPQIANIVLDNDMMYAIDEKDNTKELMESDQIIEFIYDTTESNELFRWKPIRVRHDKTLKYKEGYTMFGNYEKVANDIWKSIIHPVTETIIRTGEIDENINFIENSYVDEYYSSDNSNTDPNKRLAYQKFHTIYVKRNLLSKIKKMLDFPNEEHGSLFDIGFGKLGDMPNWKHNKISYVFGMDNSSNNYENAVQIYKETPKPKPEIRLVLGDFSKLIFPNYDCALDSHSKSIMKKSLFSKYQFDIMTSYFSLTYFYENEISIRSFFQNVNDNLKIGGFLIGTCFDGQKVIESFGSKKIMEGKKNGKTIWKIEKLYRNGKFNYSKPLFGKEINVFISSIGKSFKENLINFEYLKLLALEYNLELVEDKSFEELYSNMSSKKNYSNIVDEITEDEKIFSFLNREFIFEKKEHSSVSLYTKLQTKIKKATKK
tara:strand:+ start:1059 stop:3842 length:2784 start_codon:yes stop_codon:yes gene_type:complete